MSVLVSRLIKLGFVRDYYSPRTKFNPEVKSYRKDYKNRTILVYLWGDGDHRVTHTFSGWETTMPTDFKTKFEMEHAIRYEMFRRDHKHYDPNLKISHEGFRI